MVSNRVKFVSITISLLLCCNIGPKLLRRPCYNNNNNNNHPVRWWNCPKRKSKNCYGPKVRAVVLVKTIRCTNMDWSYKIYIGMPTPYRHCVMNDRPLHWMIRRHRIRYCCTVVVKKVFWSLGNWVVPRVL